MGVSISRRLGAFAVSFVVALGLVPAPAFALRAQVQPLDTAQHLPFALEETDDGVLDSDVSAQKLTLLDSSVQVVDYQASQGCGYLLVKENNHRDRYFHLYLVGAKGVAKEFQNTDESVIDAITVERCWTGGSFDDGSASGNTVATVSHNEAYQSLYAVKTPSGAYDVFNADTGEYFEHQLAEKPTRDLTAGDWTAAGVSFVKKSGEDGGLLHGMLRADGSYLYAPKFSELSFTDDHAGVGVLPGNEDGDEEKHALVTPWGACVSKDGTAIDAWDSVSYSSGDGYAEVWNYGDGHRTIVRISDGATFEEEPGADIESNAVDGELVGEDWAISNGYSSADDAYSSMIYNPAYPQGFDMAKACGSPQYVEVRKGVLGGYLALWRNGESYTSGGGQGTTRVVTHYDLYDDELKLVKTSDDAHDGAYVEGSGFQIPVGCYGELVIMQDLWEYRVRSTNENITCKGPDFTTVNITDLVPAGDYVLARTGDGKNYIIDVQTGQYPMPEYYDDSLGAYYGTMVKYRTDASYNNEEDDFGLFNVKTGGNSGVTFGGSSEYDPMFFDADEGFSMTRITRRTLVQDDEYSSHYEDNGSVWVDGQFGEIKALGDAYADEFFSNSSVEVDPAMNSILVQTDDEEGEYTLFSYAGGTVTPVADFAVHAMRSKDYAFNQNMESDYALVYDEAQGYGRYHYGLISRDGTTLVDPEFEHAAAPGRNLFAFSGEGDEGYVPGDDDDDGDEWELDDYDDAVCLRFFDHTGVSLAKLSVPCYNDSGSQSDGDIQPYCPFVGDLTAAYRSTSDSRVFYLYDFSDVHRAAVGGHVRVTEKMLYTTDQYSDLLHNVTYDKRSQLVIGALEEQVAGWNSDWQYAKSYAKTMMKSWTKSLETAWKDRIFTQTQPFNGTERELYEALAQELVETIMKADNGSVFNNGGACLDTVQDALDDFDGYFKTYKRYKSIYKYADTDTETIRQYSAFLSKIMTPSWEKPNNNRRNAFMQSLQKDEFYETLGDAERVLGNGMDVLDAVTTYACICRLDAELVHSIAQYVPQDSGLHYGLESLQTKITNPTASMVADFINSQMNDALVDLIKDKGIEEAMKSMLGLSSSAVSGYVAIGSLFYYVISENMDTVSLDDRLKSEFALHNAYAMSQAQAAYRDHIIALNDEGVSVNFKEAKKCYTLLFKAFNASLAQAVESIDAVVEADGGTPGICRYRGIYDANKTALEYPAYIRSCRLGAEEQWEPEGDAAAILANQPVADGGVSLPGVSSVPVSFDAKTGAVSAEGLNLQVTYEDGSTETVTEGYTVEAVDANTVAISYGGVSTQVGVAGGTVGRPVTVRFVDADGEELQPAEVAYVAYDADSFSLDELPEVEGYASDTDSTAIANDGGRDEYMVTYTRTILGDGDLSCDASIEPEDGAQSVQPAVKVMLAGKELVEGMDYELTYQDNEADEEGLIGAYDEVTGKRYVHVVITGKGAYSGTAYASIAVSQGDDPTPGPGDDEPVWVSSEGIAVTLSAKSFTYNGKVRLPQVKTVTVEGGTRVPASDFDVWYDEPGSTNVGTYIVYIVLDGDYVGSKEVTYTINPKGTSLKKLTRAKKKLKATWAKQAKQTTGYQLRYSLKKNFKSGVKTLSVKGAKKTTATIKKLKSKKTYYVQVRTYKKVGGKTYYSAWSKAKKAKVK